eukprot:12399504-Karenia_brevis.AAC.1
MGQGLYNYVEMAEERVNDSICQRVICKLLAKLDPEEFASLVNVLHHDDFSLASMCSGSGMDMACAKELADVVGDISGVSCCVCFKYVCEDSTKKQTWLQKLCNAMQRDVSVCCFTDIQHMAKGTCECALHKKKQCIIPTGAKGPTMSSCGSSCTTKIYSPGSSGITADGMLAHLEIHEDLIFCYENVEQAGKGEFWKALSARLTAANYMYWCKTLNTKDYYLPQRRK